MSWPQGEWLLDVFKTSCLDIFKTFSRCLEKMSSRHIQDLFRTFLRRLQDVFKIFWRRLAKTSSRRLQNLYWTSCKNVFKVSSRRFEDVFKTSSRRLAKMSPRRFKDISSSYCFFNTSSRSIQHVSETYCKGSYLQKDLPRSHLWNGRCTKFARVIKTSEVLVFHFTARFSGCLKRHFVTWSIIYSGFLLRKYLTSLNC